MDPHDFVLRRGRPDAPWECAEGPSAMRVADGGATLWLYGRVRRVDGEDLRALDGAARAKRVLTRVRDDPQRFAQIEGDFVACLHVERSLWAYRSLAGSVALFAATDGSAVGTRLSCVALAPPRLDRERVLEVLLEAPGLGYAVDALPVQGARLLAPGELLTVDAAGRLLRRSLDLRDYRYASTASASREAVAEGLRAVLSTVVDELLVGRSAREITCEISGGLDSAFVASLVGRQRPGASALMYAWPEKPSHRVCEEDARTVARGAGLALTVLTPEQLGDLDLGAAVPYEDTPSGWFWYTALVGGALAARVLPGSLVLSGFGSDQLFMRSRAVVARLLREGQAREAHRIARAAAQATQRSEANLLLQSALTLVPRRVYAAVNERLARARLNPLAFVDLEPEGVRVEPIAWLSLSRAQLASTAERLDERARRAAAQTLGAEHFFNSDLSYRAAPERIVGRTLARAQIAYASPFLDLRLADFVAREVPLALVHDFEARPKELLRAAMRGLVDESVRGRTGTFFHWSGFMARFVDRHASSLRALLDGCEALDLGVDVRAARAAFEQLRFGSNEPSSQRLFALFGVLLWWRSFVDDAARTAGRFAQVA